MTLASKMACLGLLLIAVIAAHMARLGVVPIERTAGAVVTDRRTGEVFSCWSGNCQLLFQARFPPVPEQTYIDIMTGGTAVPSPHPHL
jgi:hypothetical protein